MTTDSSSTRTLSPPVSRNVLIAGSVVVFHVGIIWALQSGLLQRAVEVIVPVALMTEFVEPPKPKIAPPPPPAPPTPTPKQVTRAPTLPPPPLPVAIADPTPAPNAPTGVLQPAPVPPPIAAPVAVAAPPAAPAAPPAPPSVQLPSTDADYLQNPNPPYPAVSRRLGEQGKVVLHVVIGIDGLAQSAKIVKSSGFERLDQSALETVMRWRYIPGKRGGAPQTMGYDVPINFVLK